MDKKCSFGMKDFICSSRSKHQLLLLGLYCALVFESAIQIFKVHRIVGLASCNPNLHLHLCDRILFQINITLNLLYVSQTNPRLSSKSYLNISLKLNRNPIAPTGTKVLVFEHPRLVPNDTFHKGNIKRHKTD